MLVAGSFNIAVVQVPACPRLKAIRHRSTKSHGSGSADDDDEGVITAVGSGLKYKEDNFLTSANLCRWIVDFGEIMLSKQVAMGSSGVVYSGKWKGLNVAVKRFISQLHQSTPLFKVRMAVTSTWRQRRGWSLRAQHNPHTPLHARLRHTTTIQTCRRERKRRG
jgi:hypothetical protein